MASIGERIRAFFAAPTSAKSAQTLAPYATSVRAQLVSTPSHMRRSTKLLRTFADRSEPVRTAINWRKQQVAQSAWRIVRTDDPKRPPNDKVVAAVTQLLRHPNPRKDSFRSLLDKIVEDLLVLDAGCLEKEKTLAGQITALWDVDGSTIAPDPLWEVPTSRGGLGCSATGIRYRQYLDGGSKPTAELRNDQLIYMMQNPTTHRVLGWSQVETLISVIEASLFGERYAFELLRNAAPPGVLDIGRGLQDQQVEAFRAYYKAEIAGTGEMAIFGGGEPGPGSGVTFTKFGWSPKDLLFDEYRQWLINVIAFVFQVDKTIFGMVDDVNRSTSRTMSARTDQGFVALARLVSEFISTEIIAELDENHGFEFMDLVVMDPLLQAKIDQIYVQTGVLTPNELRAERFGLDPVAWGDAPYNATGSATPDPLSDDEQNAESDGATEPAGKGGKDTESAKRLRPFAARPTPAGTPTPKRSLPSISERSTKPSADG